MKTLNPEKILEGKHIIFISRVNTVKNGYNSQSKIQTQCNLHQNFNAAFHRKRENNHSNHVYV